MSTFQQRHYGSLEDIEHSSYIATLSVQDSEVCLERYIEKSIGSQLDPAWVKIFIFLFFLNGEMVATKIPGGGN